LLLFPSKHRPTEIALTKPPTCVIYSRAFIRSNRESVERLADPYGSGRLEGSLASRPGTTDQGRGSSVQSLEAALGLDCMGRDLGMSHLLRGSVNRRVANVTTVGQEVIRSFGELSGKESSQPIDGSSK
jgi:hypothetical protein